MAQKNVETLHWLYYIFFVQLYNTAIFKDLRFKWRLKTRIFYDTPYMLHTSQFTVGSLPVALISLYTPHFIPVFIYSSNL